MTTISIAMATYNGARFIREQLDSLAAQTVLPLELIVTDDGSSDDTLAIIEEFAKTAPFQVQIVRNETRLGFRTNFMKCATLCTGDLIAFCDQDDIWFEQKLERQLSHFADPMVFLSCHNAKLIDQQGRDVGRSLHQFPSSLPFSYCSASPFAYCHGFTQVFRRQLLSFFCLWDSSIEHYMITERMAHDRWYFFLALVIGFVKYDPESLALYRQHDLNTSGPESEPKNAVSKILHKIFSDWRPQYEPLRAAAANREQILKTLSSNIRNHPEISPNAKVEDRVKNACLMWAEMHESLERRHSLYSTTSFSHRLRILISSVKNGDYKMRNANGWKFTIPGLIRDCIYTLAPRDRGPARPSSPGLL
jgi:glycosyltransferase involved in cell wall biosynthesis